MPPSGFYQTEIIGNLRPPAQILQWDIDEVNPSGYRHIESGVYKPDAKLGLRGGFTAQKESGVALDFGEIYANENGFYTDTVCMTFNLGEVNDHPDSYFNNADGIGTNFKTFNMKFWMSNMTAFTDKGYNPDFYYKTFNIWQSGISLKSDTPGVLVVPSALPSLQNIYSKNSQIFISGVYREAEFSNFIYTVGKFPSGVYELGSYGGLGSGNFIFRLTYDWTNIDANVLPTDR